MSKYIKLDIEKLYEKHNKDIKMYNCTFNSNVVCDEDCPFHGWTCEMMDWLESLPVLIVPKTINGVVLKDCDKVIEPFLEEHEYGDLWEAVRALRDFYDWITEEERNDNE